MTGETVGTDLTDYHRQVLKEIRRGYYLMHRSQLLLLHGDQRSAEVAVQHRSFLVNEWVRNGWVYRGGAFRILLGSRVVLADSLWLTDKGKRAADASAAQRDEENELWRL